MSYPNEWFLAKMKIPIYELKKSNHPEFWIIFESELDKEDPFLLDLIHYVDFPKLQFHFTSLSDFRKAKTAPSAFLCFLQTHLPIDLKSHYQHYEQFTVDNFEAFKHRGESKKSFWQAIENWLNLQ